jgi:hypothetical protein
MNILNLNLNILPEALALQNLEIVKFVLKN